MALALGCLIDSTINNIQFNHKSTVFFRITSVLAFVLAIGLNSYFCGKVGRDKDMLADIHAILPCLPENTPVSTTPTMRSNYHFWAYMERYKEIYYSNTDSQTLYFIASSNDDLTDSSYQYMETGATNFYLYKKRINED